MRAVIAIVLTVLAAAGCKSDTEKQFAREQILIAPPMEHDPTDRVVLKRWWANEDHLLRLDGNAAYALYDGLNRFAPPIERGRWSQQSYAVVWLEPYNTIKVDPRRVSVTKIDGRLALVIPDKQPMHAMDHPPQVMEDRIVGVWSGPIGTLHLNSDLRFALTPADPLPPGASIPNLRAMHKGSWHIAGDHLVLNADIPGIEPLVMPIVGDETNLSISAPGGAISRSADVAKAATP